MVKININLSNRWLYSILAVIIVILAGVAVWALEAGVAGDPGHTMATIAPPDECVAGQFLNWTGSDWECADLPAAGAGDIFWSGDASSISYGGNVGIGTSPTPGVRLHVIGKLMVTDKIFGWSHPSNVKGSNYHDGDFGGYGAMENWIQNNGCSGYHVCSHEELSSFWQEWGPVLDFGVGWYAGAADNDCYGWNINTDPHKGTVWVSDVNGYARATTVSCTGELPVWCCK